METVIGLPADGSCMPSSGCVSKEVVVPYNEERRKWGDDWPPNGYTMIGKVRLHHFMACIAEVTENNISGAIVELGVWRGGAMISAAAMLKALSSSRPLHIFDAFGEIPGYGKSKNFLHVEMDYVKQGFSKYGLLDSNVHFHKGLFVRDRFKKGCHFLHLYLAWRHGSSELTLCKIYFKLISRHSTRLASIRNHCDFTCGWKLL